MNPLSTTNFLPDAFQGARDDIAMQIQLLWTLLKAPLITPFLNMAILLCSTMSLMLFIEKVYMSIIILLVKVLGREPEKRYGWEPIKDDVEAGNTAYPMVLVQIPMYNEKEVYFFLLPFDSAAFTFIRISFVQII